MTPEATTAGSTTPLWTVTITTSTGATMVCGPSGTLYSYSDSWTSANGLSYSHPPETETERLIREFGEELQRYLDTFARWAGMSRTVRRAAFFARRLREHFVARDVRPRRRACSMATRWMVTR